MTKDEALDLAAEKNLDLVLVSANPENPVCKIMNYGKHKFEQAKREKESKKRDNERYAGLVKSASTPSSKASYRKQKVDAAARHDSHIESLKRQIESAKESLKREK